MGHNPFPDSNLDDPDYHDHKARGECEEHGIVGHVHPEPEGAGTGIPAIIWLNLERRFRAGLAAGKTWTR